MSPLERFADLLVSAGKRVVWNGAHTAFKFCCCLHDDHDPSCDATTGDRVPVIASCQVCGPNAALHLMLEELGATDEDRDLILGGSPSSNGTGGCEVVNHDYRDATGKLVLRVVRHMRSGKTVKVQRMYHHAGAWCWPGDLPLGAKPDTRSLLYNGQAVRAAAAAGGVVYIGEGERVVDALTDLGLPATCNAGGASENGKAPKWTLAHAEQLRGAGAAVLWQDNDPAGAAHVEAESATLQAIGVATIKVVRFPDLPPKADLVDWLATVPADQRRDRLQALIDTAPRWAPEAAAAAAVADRFVTATLSGPAILDHDFPRPPSLLGDGVVGAGDLVVIFGEAGMSKTYLTLQLAIAQARGEQWLDLNTTAGPVDVGFIELEIHGHTIQDRLRSIGGPVPDTFHLLVRPQLRGAVDLVNADGDPVHLPELRAWIEHKRLKVVYLDALARATSCPQVDFSPLLLALDVLRADTGCAVTLVHHENSRDRGAGAGDLDFLRGDSRLRGFPQAILRVLEHHGVRCIRFPKVNCAAQPDPIYFKRDENGVPLRAEPPEALARAKGKDTEAAIERFVLGAPAPVSREQIEKAVGRKRVTVLGHLRDLLDAGRIDAYGANKDTRYLPPAGAAGTSQPAGGNNHEVH